MSDKKIRILIADDQNLFAENLKTVIETRADDMTVVGIAGDGDEAVRMAKELWPDVILMDVCMPRQDGVKAIREIRSATTRPKILVLTTFGDDDYVLEALKFGASGYLLKDISMPELIQTIRGLGSGTITMSPGIADSLLRTIDAGRSSIEGRTQATGREGAGTGSEEAKSVPKWIDLLGRRERQILRLMAEGRNNYDIGARLGISEQTVKNNVSSIYEKSGIHDRYMIIKEAERMLYLLEEP
jgi:DNA-binding NarL/FixJ family response regulator